MPCLPSIPALALLVPAALIAAFNWGGIVVNMVRLCRRHYQLVPLIYLASTALTAAALLIDPRPACAWMILVPLADFSNHVLPWIVMGRVWERLRRALARGVA